MKELERLKAELESSSSKQAALQAKLDGTAARKTILEGEVTPSPLSLHTWSCAAVCSDEAFEAHTTCTCVTAAGKELEGEDGHPA